LRRPASEFGRALVVLQCLGGNPIPIRAVRPVARSRLSEPEVLCDGLSAPWTGGLCAPAARNVMLLVPLSSP